jgi:hypothetical protein
MNQSKNTAVLTEVEVERPRALVLHFAPDSGPSEFSNLQSEDSAMDYFSGAVRGALQLPGLREIILELPEEGRQGQRLLERVGSLAADSGFEFSSVVQPDQVREWGTGAFAHCGEVALRIDAARYPGLKLTREFYELVDRLRADSRLVRFHVQLSSELIRRLALPRLRRWLDRADFLTLVAPWGQPADFDRVELSALFERLSPVWEKPDRFFHLHVDRNIKPDFFPWNLLSVTCPAADLALHLDADGRLFLSAAPRPFAVLAQPELLAPAVERHLQLADRMAGL